MGAHLESCVATQDAKGAAAPLIALRIHATGAPRYWIDVEMRSATKLRHLDAFLRQLWLECCGHLSAFAIDAREVAMSASVGTALGAIGATFRYEYDFGDTTALDGTVWMLRQGKIGREHVRLLARNDAPVWRCTACAAPATVVCPYCPDDGIFCETHAEAHEHASEDAYLPVVNSPRMGVFAYVG